MNFWILAIALLAISAVLISWPLITGSAKDRITALFIILMTPLAGILLYQSIGTPDAIKLKAAPPQQAAQQAAQQQAGPHSDQQGQMDELVASLQQRMAENPNDPDGWLILGRSLRTMQRYSEAETAMANANRLKPNDPMIMIELAETSLFASGKAQVSPETRQLIEAALAIDPKMQKALWLMGMAYAQDGDDVTAITHWKNLLAMLDPTSGAASSVNQQIEMAQLRIGGPATAPAMPPAVMQKPAATQTASAEPAAAGVNIPVTISIADDLAASVPANSVLFVFIHNSGTRGMPLAVKRLAPKGFPLTLQFTDADKLQPGGSLADFDKLDISARISMSGIANTASGDYQATMATVDTKAITAIALNLDQRVP
jgi:cytochrome c-type biogenesis protein CcmH